jgi:transposase
VIVVWDGGSIHRGEPFRELEEAFAGRLMPERLPLYARELNPVEFG